MKRYLQQAWKWTVCVALTILCMWLWLIALLTFLAFNIKHASESWLGKLMWPNAIVKGYRGNLEQKWKVDRREYYCSTECLIKSHAFASWQRSRHCWEKLKLCLGWGWKLKVMKMFLQSSQFICIAWFTRNIFTKQFTGFRSTRPKKWCDAKYLSLIAKRPQGFQPSGHCALLLCDCALFFLLSFQENFEVPVEPEVEKPLDKKEAPLDTMRDLSLVQFLKSGFENIVQLVAGRIVNTHDNSRRNVVREIIFYNIYNKFARLFNCIYHCYYNIIITCFFKSSSSLVQGFFTLIVNMECI